MRHVQRVSRVWAEQTELLNDQQAKKWKWKAGKILKQKHNNIGNETENENCVSSSILIWFTNKNLVNLLCFVWFLIRCCNSYCVIRVWIYNVSKKTNKHEPGACSAALSGFVKPSILQEELFWVIELEWRIKSVTVFEADSLPKKNKKKGKQKTKN